ncbi:MAG: AAC(3) family N-acetyltransferase [Actinocatenispora sp.]
MPEPVEDTPEPRTRASLAADLRALGVRAGSVLLVHSSLSSLGWVCGGPVAVVQALLDALGPDGTLVVPTHTGDNSDPAMWQRPPVPAAWWPVIRNTMPAFDPAVTPSRGLGVIPELARTWPGAVRSGHPATSFAAIGPAAEEITRGHLLHEGLGDESPLGRIHAADGDVLLLGVGHDNNTSLHLAEARIPESPRISYGAAVAAPDGGRQWVTWIDVDYDSDDFDRLGADLDAVVRPAVGTVGSATCTLARQRDVVDFAVEWLRKHRPLS